jgi:hypothetical protein
VSVAPCRMRCYLRFACRCAFRRRTPGPLPFPSMNSTPAASKARRSFATILADMTGQLATMDRYERRALSRRKFAIRVSMQHEGGPPARAIKRQRWLYR